jgi:hypothetical protein
MKRVKENHRPTATPPSAAKVVKAKKDGGKRGGQGEGGLPLVPLCAAPLARGPLLAAHCHLRGLSCMERSPAQTVLFRPLSTWCLVATGSGFFCARMLKNPTPPYYNGSSIHIVCRGGSLGFMFNDRSRRVIPGSWNNMDDERYHQFDGEKSIKHHHLRSSHE